MRLIEIPEIAELSTPEKILFIEDLWNSITADDETIPVPESHKHELDGRFQKHRENPGRLLSLEELQSRIESRK